MGTEGEASEGEASGILGDSGLVSGPFGIYHGTPYRTGPDGSPRPNTFEAPRSW